MALVYVSAELDSPEAKALYFTLTEAEVANTETAITFGGCGLQNLNAVPVEYFATEITPATAAPTGACNFAFTAVSAFGFSVVKTSAASGAVLHTFVVYFHTRPFYG